MKLDSAALTRAILTADVRRLPGFIRLDPSISDSTFESHWMFLVHCATEMLAQGEEEETVYSALAAITKPYSAFPCQTKDELMPAFWVRLLQAYFDAQQSLERQGKGTLLPHPDLLIDMVYNTALRAHTTKVKALLLSTDPYEEKDLTLEIVAALYNNAARIARTGCLRTTQA